LLKKIPQRCLAPQKKIASKSKRRLRIGGNGRCGEARSYRATDLNINNLPTLTEESRTRGQKWSVGEGTTGILNVGWGRGGQRCDNTCGYEFTPRNNMLKLEQSRCSTKGKDERAEERGRNFKSEARKSRQPLSGETKSPCRTAAVVVSKPFLAEEIVLAETPPKQEGTKFCQRHLTPPPVTGNIISDFKRRSVFLRLHLLENRTLEKVW